MTNSAPRGTSHPNMRLAECKDCRRLVAAGRREPGTEYFTYPEAWAAGQLDRGGSRSDRCREHRQTHHDHISGIAVAYIDLDTTGEVADRDNPRGPLGGLGPLPPAHQPADTPGVDLDRFGFGMDEGHIRAMLQSLADPHRRVLVVKAGTGTGKSTYMPYRLLDPPDGSFRLTDLGPIIVTEPRVQATVGVATFVGTAMSGAGGVGPGYPVGYQVAGDRQHDASCQLVYVTDGTMINWLREGRLSTIGTVIVDEAHERSTNIDFILGYLRREIDRYPHLRVIITSATFDADFYQQYFGGSSRAGKIEVPSVKSIGYGWPLFPELDATPGDERLTARWARMAPELALAEPGAGPTDPDELITRAWPRFAPPLSPDEVRDPADAGYVEDLHATTRTLIALRHTAQPPPRKEWAKTMPGLVADFAVKLANGLDQAGIYGDILAFLPTAKAIEEACDMIRANLGAAADVYALLSSLPLAEKEAALAARRMGDRRKIVVSTNLAETSLTVEGVRFVVDSGLIAQSEWDVSAAQGGIRTKPHSQAGIKQRWGRVGRKGPGWVFPLYSKDQLLELAEDTAPGSTRENLENLVMTAKMGGISSVTDFPWPAAFQPEPPVVLDKTAKTARQVFVAELGRADEALKTGGALDSAGDPTSFGKELTRLQVLGSTGAALAVMFADRLGCVPEVATLLALLNNTQLVGPRGLLLYDDVWPDEWRLEATERHRALASACEDDAELVLQVVAGWERSDPSTAPWEPSDARRAWAHRWWLNHDALLEAAEKRRDILGSLSPAMKEEVKRFTEPALLRRSRGAITRAFTGLEHLYDGVRFTRPVAGDDKHDCMPDDSVLTKPPARSIPLNRRRRQDVTFLSNFVTLEPWALDPAATDAPGPAGAVQLLVLSSQHARVEPRRDVLGAVLEAWPAGTRAQLRFSRAPGGAIAVADVLARHDPATLPVAAEELAELDDSEDQAHGGGTAEDASPELDTRWPTGRAAEPDTEALARVAVMDHRDIEASETACGRCDACLRGDLDACTDPRGAMDDPRREPSPTAPTGVFRRLRALFSTVEPTAAADEAAADALADWRSRATLGIDASTPAVLASDSELEDGNWFEVTGYAVSGGEPAVRLRADWRQPDHTHGPGQHPDLHAGDLVEVTVDGTIRDHRGDLRVFLRVDGRGRFLLREADFNPRKQDEKAQLAASLNRRHSGQLAALERGSTLSATVLPQSQDGHFTITLLNLLHHHLEWAAAQTPGKPANGRRTPALVTGEPNAAGYVDLILLARDTTTGIRHVLSAPGGATPAEPGQPVLVDIYRDRPALRLQGRPLGDVHTVVDHLDDISLAGLPDGTVPPIGSSSTRLEPAAFVTTASALELAALELDHTWARDVWQFWARSRHRHADGLAKGSATSPVEVPARPRVELPPELRLPVERITAMHPPGSRVSAVVTLVRDDLGRAWLRLTDGTPASITAADAHLDGRALSAALPPDEALSADVKSVVTHKGYGQLNLTLRPQSVGRARTEPAARPPKRRIPTLEEARAHYLPGTPVEGSVSSISPEHHRAWIGLPDGLEATVSAGDLGSTGVLEIDALLEIGQPVTATVKSVSEVRGKAQVKVELRDLAVPAFGQQLRTAGLIPGNTMTGTVKEATRTGGLLVELRPGLEGEVRPGALRGRSSADFPRGLLIEVRVLEANSHPHRRGQATIFFTLV